MRNKPTMSFVFSASNLLSALGGQPFLLCGIGVFLLNLGFFC